MTIITLTDIQKTNRKEQILPKNNSAFTVDSTATYNFHLVMKQLFMQLPVQPFLNKNPQIATWVKQVKKLAPELFTSRRKLLVEHQINAPIILDSQQEFVQVFTNVGFKRGIPKLYEWAVRHPVLSWQDKVKLWATTLQYSISPDQLQLVIIAIHPQEKAQRLNVVWNYQDHKKTERWLMKLLTQSPDNRLSLTTINSEFSSMIDLASIPEVEI